MIGTEQLQLRSQKQINRVADEVAAVIAAVRPILQGTLFTLKREVVEALGGYEGVTLAMLSRVYRQGDGDCGICFEYAVHDAVVRKQPMVVEKVLDAVVNHCRVPGADPASILFAVEKSGSEQIVDTRAELLTDDSVLMSGVRGRPVKLRRHLSSVASAFRRPTARTNLPQSISGLWKADLFLGTSDEDRWVGTSVRINPRHLERARGLRIGVVPTLYGSSDAIRRDGDLVICPLPHDASFMEVFYQAWGVVQQVIAADAQMPREVALPRAPDRQVARELVSRRSHPVLDVVAALEPLAQPELMESTETDLDIIIERTSDREVGSVVAPMPAKPT